MKLLLRRLECMIDHTAGNLLIDGQFECMTLEDQVRCGPKVFGETAIPAGTYDVVVTYSPHFKRDLPLVLGVPGFEAIRIHPGNTTNDTEGCILVGQFMQGNELRNSRAAFDALYSKIETSIKNGQKITLEIS